MSEETDGLVRIDVVQLVKGLGWIGFEPSRVGSEPDRIVIRKGDCSPSPKGEIVDGVYDCREAALIGGVHPEYGGPPCYVVSGPQE